MSTEYQFQKNLMDAEQGLRYQDKAICCTQECNQGDNCPLRDYADKSWLQPKAEPSWVTYLTVVALVASIFVPCATRYLGLL